MWLTCTRSHMSDSHARLERLTSMLRRRGIILPAFEIHGGVAGLFDFGPNGARLCRRLKDSWIEHWSSHGNIVEIDSPTITPESVVMDRRRFIKGAGTIAMFGAAWYMGCTSKTPNSPPEKIILNQIEKKNISRPAK